MTRANGHDVRVFNCQYELLKEKTGNPACTLTSGPHTVGWHVEPYFYMPKVPTIRLLLPAHVGSMLASTHRDPAVSEWYSSVTYMRKWEPSFRSFPYPAYWPRYTGWFLLLDLQMGMKFQGRRRSTHFLSRDDARHSSWSRHVKQVLPHENDPASSKSRNSDNKKRILYCLFYRQTTRCRITPEYKLMQNYAWDPRLHLVEVHDQNSHGATKVTNLFQ